MSFKPKPPKSNRKQVPIGTHHAICYGIIDTGTQFSEKFDKESQEIILNFEFPDHRDNFDDGDGNMVDKPLVLSRTYTLSFHEKSNLCKDLTAWLGRPPKAGDIQSRMGANCFAVIEHTESGKSKIASIVSLHSSVTPKEPENPKIMYEIEQGEPPETMYDWIKDRIKESKEFQAMSDNAQELPCDYNGSEPTPGDDIIF